MIYVGSNDGMLHALDAATGREVLAYVPSKVFGNLNKLTSLNYSHRYFVDGSPEVADAKVGGQWRTTLVGGLGGGGHGLYALDVTAPAGFSEANASQLVLWEFNDTDDADLGYVYGKPAIRKMANGKWAAIVSGGYHTQGDSVVGTGHGVLFIIFLDGPTGAGRTWVNGTDYIKIDTGAGTATTPNGLAAPLAVDGNLDGATDYVYAGDQLGNLWKFDVSSANASNWSLAANRVSLFQAKDGLGNAQPITTQPEGTVHPTGRGYVITFGTGKYIEVTDPSGPYYGQSFYGIWDKNDSAGNVSNQTRVTGRTQLLQQTITDTPSGGVNYRVVSNNTVNWSTDTTPPLADDSPVKDVGWFMDFPNGTATGERSVFRPLLLANRLIFTTLMPSTAVCAFGGTSYMFIVDPTTGARIDTAVLDADANGKLNIADKILSSGVSVYASGVESKVGIMPTPTIILGGSNAANNAGNSATSTSQIYGTAGPLRQGFGSILAYAIGGGSTGNRTSAVIGLGALSGRVSWREVLTR
jgi:type IV pilus assembly protein PilY1